MYQGYKQLVVEKQDKILVITFNNPKKRNAVNIIAYGEIQRVMDEVATDDSVTVVVFTGAGDYFTAGNDLSAGAAGGGGDGDMDEQMKQMNNIFRGMVTSIVNCPKILIALVNGPAIGIGTTLAAICDICWCSENAYFLTPFTRLGLVPEACSSYLLPLIVGRSKANEMLLFNEKLSAVEAQQYKFVSRAFKLAEINSVIWPKIREYANLPPNSLQASKKLIRMSEIDGLLRSLNAECDALLDCMHQEEFFTAIMNFASRKSKL